MEYNAKKGNIHVFSPDFRLSETLDCGQAFRWEETDKGYKGYALDRYLELSEKGDEIILHNTSEEEFLSFWKNYFDLDTDYTKLKSLYSSDETLKNACNFAGGIRLLRQDFWEALVSFIISQNNNIPRIKKIISSLCEMYGGFPDAKKLCSLSPEDLSPIRAGFRAKYIIDAAKKVTEGEIDESDVRTLPLDQARKKLMTIKGVGPKVADCVLLYGCYRTDAFPVDVWIKRVMADYYPDGFPSEFSETAGIAQQYLFHYIRNSGKNS